MTLLRSETLITHHKKNEAQRKTRVISQSSLAILGLTVPLDYGELMETSTKLCGLKHHANINRFENYFARGSFSGKHTKPRAVGKGIPNFVKQGLPSRTCSYELYLIHTSHCFKDIVPVEALFSQPFSVTLVSRTNNLFPLVLSFSFSCD